MERPEDGREPVQGPTPPTSPASQGLDPKQGLVDAYKVNSTTNPDNLQKGKDNDTALSEFAGMREFCLAWEKDAPKGSLASQGAHRPDVNGAKPSSSKQIKDTTDDAETQYADSLTGGIGKYPVDFVGDEQRLPGNASPSPSAISPDSRTEREGLGNAKFNSNDTTRYE